MSALAARIYAELRGDRAIWAILLLISVFGVLAIYSSAGALAYQKYGGDTEYPVYKHLILLVMGLFMCYMAHLIHYSRYMRWAPVFLTIAVPLLMYTLAFGPEINEARRWVQIPFTQFTLQTSDFAKLALIIYVARGISSKQDYIDDLKEAFLPIIFPVVLVCGLIAPSDLSTAILLFVVCLFMMIVGRVNLRYVALLIFSGLIMFAILVFLAQAFPDYFRLDTWAARLAEFTGGEEGYQTTQAKIAIASGEWFGLGPGNSIQRNYLPYAYADSIYAIIVEEYGIFGGITVIGLYLLLLFRVVRLVTMSPKAFGAMVAMGLAFLLVLQAYLNIAVSLDLVPVTGLVLPLISMGGTSLLFTCISFGIILSVSKYIEAGAK